MFKIGKRITPVILCVMCMLFGSMPAFAAETGSIDVTLKAYASDEVVSGGTLALYKVADVAVNDTGQEEFIYTSDFMTLSDAYLVEDKLKEAETADIFADVAGSYDPQALVTVDNAGYASFSELDKGLYLIMQGTAASGFEGVKPFLVTMPMYEDGNEAWSINATPKTTPVTKKTEETKKTDSTKKTDTTGDKNDNTKKNDTTSDKSSDTTTVKTTGNTGDNAGVITTGTTADTAKSTSSPEESGGESDQTKTTGAKTGDMVPLAGFSVSAAAAVVAIALAVRKRRAAR